MRHSFVPLRKQSKKVQRAYHAGQRGSWNGLSPVTRTVPSGRVGKIGLSSAPSPQRVKHPMPPPQNTATADHIPDMASPPYP